MTKDIWHTADEKPMLHSEIILCGDGWSMPIDIIPETVNNICWKNVEKWCYVDDLLALETENKDLSDKIGKLEIELDHSCKAFDRAIWWLNEIVENHRFTPISTAEKALKELKEQQ